MPKTPCPIELGNVFKIKTKEEAQAFLKKYHTWFISERPDLTPEKCMGICRSNIGYFSGYGSSAMMRKVQELFDVAHPIFGRSEPTAKEAFETGKRMGARANRKGG